MSNDEMRGVSHTNPYTGDTFGRSVFQRGPAVADGGVADDDDPQTARMEDVEHTPPHGDGANEVWKRGEGEHAEDVEDADDESVSAVEHE